IVSETPLPSPEGIPRELCILTARLAMSHKVFALEWLTLFESYADLGDRDWQWWWAIRPAQRLACRAAIEAIVATLYGLGEQDVRWILRECDYPAETLARSEFRRQLPPKGFWRVGVGSAEHEWN